MDGTEEAATQCELIGEPMPDIAGIGVRLRDEQQQAPAKDM